MEPIGEFPSQTETPKRKSARKNNKPSINQNKFIAIDFETANHRRNSICQIGMICFENNEEGFTLDTLIDPEEEFHEFIINIHKIQPSMVIGAPKFYEVYENITNQCENTVIVSWTDFDKQCFEKAMKKYSLQANKIYWLDATSIICSVWPQYINGYKLKNVAKDFGISFKHHVGIEDAKACGLLVQKALIESNTTIDYWFDKYGETINIRPPKAPIRELQNRKVTPIPGTNLPVGPIGDMMPKPAFKNPLDIKECVQCNAKIHIDAITCPKCGKDLSKSVAIGNTIFKIGMIPIYLIILAVSGCCLWSIISSWIGS
jgi:DNA polymerase-3 subunit epsilon